MNLESWSHSHIGLVRRSNQDAVGCFPELHLYIVADGLGGHADGELASRMAVEAIHESLAVEGKQGELLPPSGGRFWKSLLGRHETAAQSAGRGSRSPLVAALVLANDRIYTAGHQGPVGPSAAMGTTVVALLCDPAGARAEWAHLGDSRLYRVHKGELRLLTADHTQCGAPYWGMPEIPLDLPHTNMLLNVLGMEPKVEVTAGASELQAGDLFLLCSDGVSGMIAPDELTNLLRETGSIEDIGQGLIRAALAAGGSDNATVLLVRAMDS